MKILVSAAEISSDLHAAEVLRDPGLCARGGIEAFGCGGPRLREAGLDCVVRAEELRAMGLTEVLSRWKMIRSAFARMEALARERRPDIALLVDYPDYHMRLAAKLQALGIPVVQLIAPKTWVWRSGRNAKMARVYDEVLCIFPFEEGFLREAGVRARYVGNPTAAELGPELIEKERIRGELGLKPHEWCVVVMPGSRPSELRLHSDILIRGAAETARRMLASGALKPGARLRVQIPLPEGAFEGGGDSSHARAALSGALEWARAQAHERIDVRVTEGDARQWLAAADAAVIKSGTSTLEASLIGCPFLTGYRMSRVSEWILDAYMPLRGPLTLGNLLAGPQADGRFLVEELIFEEFTPEQVGRSLERLLTDEKERGRLSRGFEVVRRRVGWGARKGASGQRAPFGGEVARALIETLERRAARDSRQGAHA